MKTLKAIAILEVIFLIAMISVIGVHATTESQDVKPYEFAKIRTATSGVCSWDCDTHIYKTVHQGCELFIAVNNYGDSKYPQSIAMTTGRGCK